MLHQIKLLNKPYINIHQKSHGGITGYSNTAGKVQRWVPTSHIIVHCELQIDEGVLTNPHSRTKDVGKSRVNFDNSCVDLLLEFLKGWTNPFDHRESLIHISSCVEASDTVQNALLFAETVGLEEMKCFCLLQKTNLSKFKHMAVKLVINSKEKFAAIASERNLLGRYLILT